MSEPFGSPKASEMVVIALRLAIGQPSAGQLLAQDIRHDGWLAMSEPFGSPKASGKESRMVRKRGFEPLRYCYRQPLKLVRLPVPPLPRGCLNRDL